LRSIQEDQMPFLRTQIGDHRYGHCSGIASYLTYSRFGCHPELSIELLKVKPIGDDDHSI
jgi:hypothetical protein